MMLDSKLYQDLAENGVVQLPNGDTFKELNTYLNGTKAINKNK